MMITILFSVQSLIMHIIPKSPQQTKHAPRKRFGQNFLHDTHIISQIVTAIRLDRQDNFIRDWARSWGINRAFAC